MAALSRFFSLPWASCARALAVSTLLAAWTLEALPQHAFNEKLLAAPAYERAILGVHTALAAVGLASSPELLKGQLLRTSAHLRDARRSLLAPLRPLYELAGMRQRWGLFRRGPSHAYRMQVEGRDSSGRWTLLYRAHETDVFVLAPQLAFRRLRGIYDGCSAKGASAQYDGLVEWLTSKLMREHRELRAVRVSLQRLRLGSRQQPADVVGVEHERVRERSS